MVQFTTRYRRKLNEAIAYQFPEIWVSGVLHTQKLNPATTT
ncbi:hypothetical protein [Nostoc sp. LEGE 06077]|nr:hypothetical protein [Nostoc sp. LEGE 06077]